MRGEGRCSSILAYPPGSSPTIWTLYLVSREEVKQSTEASSTWGRAGIRAWEEMGPLAEATRAQPGRGSKCRISWWPEPSNCGSVDVFGMAADRQLL